MKKQWIVVADAARARVFARDAANSGLTLLDTLKHSESEAHEGDLRTGGKGEVHDSGGSGQHQADPQTSTSEKHAGFFAKELVDHIKSGFNDDQFDQLVIVADPQFLGRVRDKLDHPLNQALIKTIDKNWAQHDERQIEKQLENQL